MDPEEDGVWEVFEKVGGFVLILMLGGCVVTFFPLVVCVDDLDVVCVVTTFGSDKDSWTLVELVVIGFGWVVVVRGLVAVV